MCPYQFILFCLRNVDIWHKVYFDILLDGMISDMVLSGIITLDPHFSYMQYVLAFLPDRPTLCSISHCWLDHRLIHLVFQLDGYLFVA